MNLQPHRNLWLTFTQECPFLCRIPVLRHYAFGVYARAYHCAKLFA